MAIIVTGYLHIKSGFRDDFVAKSQAMVVLARQHACCDDFSVSADAIDLNRVNIVEKWQSSSALEQFRSQGCEHDLFHWVERFTVSEYEVER